MATNAADMQDEFPPLRGMQLGLLTLFLALTAFMEVLDLTIVNVSLPAIAGSLGVSPAEAAWTVSSYSLAAAILQPMTGWLGRRYGEVRTFTTCLFLFVTFSALCGVATSMPMLIGARLLQGLVSGPMVALGQALMIRNYPQEKRGTAMGLFAMVIIIAPIFGPILGGWITDNLSWPWLFYINVPIGIMALIVTLSLLRGRESKLVIVPVDSIGLILLVIGVGCLQFTLDNGNDKDWFSSTEILIAAVVAFVAISYLIIWELGDKHPVLDLHLLRDRNFVIGMTTVSGVFFLMFASNIIFPLWLQTTLDYTATWAGLAMAPIGIFAIMIAPLVGKNVQHLNLRWAATASLLIFSIAMYWMSTMTDQASPMQLAAPRLLQGLGIPLMFLPLNQIAFSNIKPHELAAAVGMNNFFRTLAGSISTAVCLLLWNNRADFHHAVLTEHINTGSPGWQHTQDTLTQLGMQGLQHAYVDNVITRQSFTLAANDIYQLFAVCFVLVLPLIWLARPPFLGRGSAASVH